MRGGTIVGLALAAFMATAQMMAQQGEGPILHPKSAPTKAPASAQAVCKFISEQMQSKLPQAPTLCSATQEASIDYEINVFSPKNVLEGDMRRAWSSALFQTLEELVEEKSLNGACSNEKPYCFVSVADSHLAGEGIRYRSIVSKSDLERLKILVKALNGTEFSDLWYFVWWDRLMSDKESDRPQSKGNAELIARGACADYVQAHSIVANLRNTKPPSCSVMLATDKSVYIKIETPYRTRWGVEEDFKTTVGAWLSNDYADLPKIIGRAFDGTGYDGQVVVKSPWTNVAEGPQERDYFTVSIRDLEFLYEEIQSGARSEADSHTLLLSLCRREGQTSMNSLLRPDGEGAQTRNAAVVTITRGQGTTASLQTTDGAVWLVSNKDLVRCGVIPGSEVFILALPERPVSISSRSCRIDAINADFATGW
jgi:hypothetical protein